jgi:hypothetical protein
MSSKTVVFAVLAVVICVVVVTWQVVRTRKEKNLLLELRSLHQVKIERITIDGDGTMRDITNRSTIDAFGQAMTATELWQPQQPLLYKNYSVVIVLASGKRIETEFSLNRDEPNTVFISFYSGVAGRYKNKLLYGWLKSIDLAP